MARGCPNVLIVNFFISVYCNAIAWHKKKNDFTGLSTSVLRADVRAEAIYYLFDEGACGESAGDLKMPVCQLTVLCRCAHHSSSYYRVNLGDSNYEIETQRWIWPVSYYVF
jgi:hypothetical protein